MAVQNTYLPTDGDLNQAKRKRAGEAMAIDAVPKQTSFDATNTPAARVQAVSAPGNPARAAQMQAQFDQPVTKGYGPNMAQQPSFAATQPASGGSGGGIGGMVQRAKDAYSVVSPLINPLGTVVDTLTAAPADYLRNSVISAAGGDPATAEGGEYANRDRTFGNLQPAINAASGAMNAVKQGVKSGVLAATGASPAPQAAAKPSTATTAVPGKPAAITPSPSLAQAAGPNAYQPTGIGDGANAIVARMSSGVPEFTSDPTAQAGSEARDLFTGGNMQNQPPSGQMVVPNGSRALASGTNAPTEAQQFAQLGSARNIGNGIGIASFGEAGDAAMALGRFERANQEREKMIQASRRGSIGEGGGRVTVVKDSARVPTRDDRLRARNDEQVARTEALRTQTQQGIMGDADKLITEQLNRQKTQQEITAGNTSAESQQRLEGLRAQMADTSLPEEQRQAAAQAYSALTISAADRYMTVQGGTNEGGGKDASKVFDRLTRTEVGGNDLAAAGPPAGASQAQILKEARDAVKQGVPIEEINRQLKDWGQPTI